MVLIIFESQEWHRYKNDFTNIIVQEDDILTALINGISLSGAVTLKEGGRALRACHESSEASRGA
jgi:hypothetical protein